MMTKEKNDRLGRGSNVHPLPLKGCDEKEETRSRFFIDCSSALQRQKNSFFVPNWWL